MYQLTFTFFVYNIYKLKNTSSYGLKEKDCIKVVDFIDAALKNKDNPKELEKLRSKINTMMTKYSLFKD